MKQFRKLIIVLVVVASLVSCGDKRTPEVQYMPDMYVSIPYDVNGVNAPYNDGIVNLKPVAGTIARGGTAAYDIPHTNEGYEQAKADLKSPLDITEANLANGKKMYTIYCGVCHGKKGDGDGILNQRDKFTGVPNYADRDITEGSIYHVIMYGRNMMGSHSSQLTVTERWQVVQYVQKLRTDLEK